MEIRDAHPLAPCLLARAAPSLRICMSCAQPPGMDPERNHRERFVLEHATIEAGMSLTADQTSTRVRVWQKRCLEKVDWAKLLVAHIWPNCNQDFFTKCVSNLCGRNHEKVDIAVLAMAAEMDLDNKDAFKNLQKHAEHCLEERVFGPGRSSVIKKTETPKPAAVEADQKKNQKAKEQEKTAKKKEYDRLFDLTPSALKALLPGGGEISGVFWMRFHPIKKFWRADYPIGAFVLETRLCLF